MRAMSQTTATGLLIDPVFDTFEIILDGLQNAEMDARSAGDNMSRPNLVDMPLTWRRHACMNR